MTSSTEPCGNSRNSAAADKPHLRRLDEDWERALAVVAHPDDVEYGAASAVARWTSQGKVVRYLLVTRGEAGIDGMDPSLVGPLREVEQRESAAVVGVEQVDLLDYPDGQVEYGLGLRRDIAAAIRSFRPEVVVSLNYRLEARGGVNMADHRVVGTAVLDAVRDAGNRWVFTDLAGAGLQPWGGVRMVLFAASPHPTHAVDVSANLQDGVASLRCHRQYLAGLSGDLDPEAFLRDEAARTGVLAGMEAAVSFEVIFF